MPQRVSVQRMQENAAALRDLVDSRSSRVVRNALAGSAISGARQKRPVPSIGARSGLLTVTGYVAGVRYGVAAIIVKCDCGFPEYTVDTSAFKSFRSTRCSICAKKAAGRKRYWKYSEAMSSTAHRVRLLNRLAAAITRCHSTSSKAYKHYGGRGISVCTEWRNDRASFLKYIQTVPGWDNPTLEMDRRETNGNYAPGNIRFVTRAVNLRNKRRVEDLEEEIARLRYCLSRAEK